MAVREDPFALGIGSEVYSSGWHDSQEGHSKPLK